MTCRFLHALGDGTDMVLWHIGNARRWIGYTILYPIARWRARNTPRDKLPSILRYVIYRFHGYDFWPSEPHPDAAYWEALYRHVDTLHLQKRRTKNDIH
jgi:hypothetical protein